MILHYCSACRRQVIKVQSFTNCLARWVNGTSATSGVDDKHDESELYVKWGSIVVGGLGVC